MKKLAATIIACVLFAAVPASADLAWDYYRRGLESSFACKKIEYFSKAIKLDPNLAAAYEKRAIHYFFQEEFDRAIADYTRVVELVAGNAEAYKMRGLNYLRKGHRQGFMAEVKRLAHRYMNMGSGDSRELLSLAIADFSRAIELDPQMAAAFAYRAEAYRLVGMMTEAIRDASAAIHLKRDPQSTALGYAALAEAYRQLGKNELYE
ncbi:MAG: hypothetical protein JRI89_17195, partial [Deltaproteobacteria bacterium]|nr:hypothetical protein [Deltaproteobacteria bacterium]